MTQVQNFNILDRIKLLVPSARSTNKIQARGAKRDSLDDARQKVVEKLQANKAYYTDPTIERPDLVYKLQDDSTCTIGVKYGNRYLKEIADGNTYLQHIPAENVIEVLDILAESVSAGHYDASIEKIMRDNVSARDKNAH